MVAAPGTAPREGWTRRELLKWTIRVAFGAFALAFALPALALRALTQQQQAVASGEQLVYAIGNLTGQLVRADDVRVGMGVQTFPQGKVGNQSNLIELVRVRAGPEGFVAYSAICTHLGCTVHERLNERNLIVCPCHASLFDPSQDARVVSGPANRPLPSIPVTVGPDGIVVTTGPFSGPIGPG